jgi:putative FmdB family regulatory protein
MPTYNYKCKECGDEFEHLQSILSDPLKACKKCKGTLVRLIGKGAGVIFKGTGFYETDYKNKE